MKQIKIPYIMLLKICRNKTLYNFINTRTVQSRRQREDCASGHWLSINRPSEFNKNFGPMYNNILKVKDIKNR